MHNKGGVWRVEGVVSLAITAFREKEYEGIVKKSSHDEQGCQVICHRYLLVKGDVF
tara:strand:+ start:386 stop:553 length:168 start_codon:yes stop_codon:yes gene_type:complete